MDSAHGSSNRLILSLSTASMDDESILKSFLFLTHHVDTSISPRPNCSSSVNAEVCNAREKGVLFLYFYFADTELRVFARIHPTAILRSCHKQTDTAFKLVGLFVHELLSRMTKGGTGFA